MAEERFGVRPMLLETWLMHALLFVNQMRLVVERVWSSSSSSRRFSAIFFFHPLVRVSDRMRGNWHITHGIGTV